MIRILSTAVTLLTLIVWQSAILAQTKSGPDAGSKVEPLKVKAITGSHAGEELDFAAAREGKPTVYIFIQADRFDRPVARFLKVLDQDLGMDRQDVAIVAVWLTDDVDKTAEYLPRAQQSMNLQQTSLTVFPGDKGGPQGWSINDRAHLTAVIAGENRVVASFGYVSLNDTNVPEVVAKLPPKR
jgi:hypothetical protein